MVILCERAARYIIRNVYKLAGQNVPQFANQQEAKNASFHDANTLAPPSCLVRNPMGSCCIFVIYANALAALSVPPHMISSSILKPGDQFQREETVLVLEAAQRLAIPVMENTGRLWYIALMYASRLKKIVEAVVFKVLEVKATSVEDVIAKLPAICSDLGEKSSR